MPVPGLLTLPDDPQASATMSLLGTHQPGAAPGTVTPTPTTPIDPLTATNQWAAALNQGAYGNAQGGPTSDFPSFADPRLIQDHLAQLATGMIQTPGVSPQDARDELNRQVNLANLNAGVRYTDALRGSSGGTG